MEKKYCKEKELEDSHESDRNEKRQMTMHQSFLQVSTSRDKQLVWHQKRKLWIVQYPE
jgi:hypothetical protein